jgi:hypothetical protein
MLMEVNKKHYKMRAKLKVILLMSWCETLIFELMYCNSSSRSSKFYFPLIQMKYNSWMWK